MMISGILAVNLYLFASLLLVWRLVKAPMQSSASRTIAVTLGLGATCIHGFFLYQDIFTYAGLNFGFFKAASLIAWLVTLLVLVSALRKPVENLCILLCPAAAITLLLEWKFASDHLILENSPWQLQAHIIISILAYSLLTIAAVQGVLLYIQDYQLRNRHPGGFIRALPPLQSMEALLFQLIGVGFVLLSLALLSGTTALDDLFGQHLVHKTVLSLLSWVVFAILLWGRWQFGWRGNTALRWTYSGFIALALAYFGSKLVLELILTP